ncbi:MAG: hypothetical protein GY953_12870, partial [bacterium]|nr:hypothetical protein [bacterium]
MGPTFEIRSDGKTLRLPDVEIGPLSRRSGEELRIELDATADSPALQVVIDTWRATLGRPIAANRAPHRHFVRVIEQRIPSPPDGSLAVELRLVVGGREVVATKRLDIHIRAKERVALDVAEARTVPANHAVENKLVGIVAIDYGTSATSAVVFREQEAAGLRGFLAEQQRVLPEAIETFRSGDAAGA